MKYDAFFYEAFEEEAAALKRYLPEGINTGFTWRTIQESKHKQCPAKIISTRTQSILPVDWKNDMEVIISRSTGFDHLLQYKNATKSNIQLGYLPLYCHRAVAEQAMLLWTALLRKLPQQMHLFKKFERDGLTGMEVQGKTIAVYGVGNIGYQVVKIARGLEMNVFGVDIIERHADVEYLSPKDAASRADIIVCAMNLTADNHNYFNRDFFKKTRPGLIFVNISRGEISLSTEVLAALQDNVIGAAALDVFDNEKDISVSLRSGLINSEKQAIAVGKMLNMQNVILTPHNAFNTVEAVERKSSQTMEQLSYYLQHKKLKWPVNEL